MEREIKIPRKRNKVEVGDNVGFPLRKTITLFFNCFFKKLFQDFRNFGVPQVSRIGPMGQVHIDRRHLHVLVAEGVDDGPLVREHPKETQLQLESAYLLESVQMVLADVNHGTQGIETLVANILVPETHQEVVQLPSPLLLRVEEKGLGDGVATLLTREH
jgi:hypothetical protein